ncbi:MAG: CpaF family protein [Gemmatimonadota bacterium]
MAESTRFSNVPARRDGVGRPAWSSGGEDPPRTPAPPPEAQSVSTTESDIQEIRSRIHRQLLERLNLTSLGERDREEAEAEVGRIVRQMLANEMAPLNLDEREQVVEQILYEVFGLGPLEPLLKDPTISDILVNTSKRIFVERNGRIESTDVTFRNDQHLLQVIDRIVSAVGRRIDDSSPMVDARLADGSRVNAIIPPLAIDGPHLSVRKFRRDVLSAEQLMEYGTLNDKMLEFLRGCVKARLNILISGGTGSGKTTFLNMLSESIPVAERVVTIEDSAELQMRQPHVVRLETRPPNIEGEGQVTQRQLVINALRMRPDRIVLGEVRGGEALDMLQAMNTGHDGSLTTLHANSPRDALTRLETMVQMAATSIGEKAMRQQISSAIDLVIQLSRLSDGGRKVMNISELVGMEGDVITMQDLFRYDRKGMDDDGNIVGEFRATGIRPKAAERLAAYGVDMEETLFADADRQGFGGRR